MADTITWRDVAVRYPEFVQWIVQTFGPLHDGGVDPGEFDRYAAAYGGHLDAEG